MVGVDDDVIAGVDEDRRVVVEVGESGDPGDDGAEGGLRRGDREDHPDRRGAEQPGGLEEARPAGGALGTGEDEDLAGEADPGRGWRASMIVPVAGSMPPQPEIVSGETSTSPVTTPGTTVRPRSTTRDGAGRRPVTRAPRASGR